MYFKQLNSLLIKKRNYPINSYPNEINFLSSNSKSGDAAISNLNDIPLYAGIYTFIPSNLYLYRDLIYSFHDSIHETVLNTLDPFSLRELNIKWILITEDLKNRLGKETKDILDNENIFNLVFTGEIKNQDTGKIEKTQIYKTKDLSNYIKINRRKTAWILINNKGQIVEISDLNKNTITLFPSHKSSVIYLNSLYNLYPKLTDSLITAQLIEISDIENKINELMTNFTVDKSNLVTNVEK